MTHFQFLLHLLFPQVLCIYLVFTIDFYQLRQCRLVMFHLVFVCVCVLSLFIVSVVYCLYSAVLVHHLLKVLYNTFAHSHLYTDGRGCHASCWPAQEVIELFLFRAPNNISTLSHSHIHTHTHTHTHTRSPLERPAGAIWGSVSCPRILWCAAWRSRNRPSDLPISGRPTIPPLTHHLKMWSCRNLL